jgi:hypothetical protein
MVEIAIKIVIVYTVSNVNMVNVEITRIEKFEDTEGTEGTGTTEGAKNLKSLHRTIPLQNHLLVCVPKVPKGPRVPPVIRRSPPVKVLPTLPVHLGPLDLTRRNLLSPPVILKVPPTIQRNHLDPLTILI